MCGVESKCILMVGAATRKTTYQRLPNKPSPASCQIAENPAILL